MKKNTDIIIAITDTVVQQLSSMLARLCDEKKQNQKTEQDEIGERQSKWVVYNSAGEVKFGLLYLLGIS